MSATVITTERRLPYAPADLAGLVSDVRRYPEFLPWMKRLEVLSESEKDGVREFVARAEVGWRAISERFTSKVRSTASSVDVSLVEGPFRRLENSWRFEPDGEGGTLVSFRVAYEFKSILLQTLASSNRTLVAGKIMSAFEKEAVKRFE